MTYSLDFRKKVFEVKEKLGLTFEQTSKRFDVPMRTLFRWQRCLEPCKTRNKPATKIDMEALAKDIKEHPDRYHWERAQLFGVTAAAICIALKRLKISYKKNAVAPQSQRKGAYGFSSKSKRLQKRR